MRIVRTMGSLEDAGRLGDITAFEAECRQATTLEQLKSLLDAIVRQFGFRWFALVHNVDLKRTTRKALDRKSTRLNSSHIQKSRMPSSA